MGGGISMGRKKKKTLPTCKELQDLVLQAHAGFLPFVGWVRAYGVSAYDLLQMTPEEVDEEIQETIGGNVNEGTAKLLKEHLERFRAEWKEVFVATTVAQLKRDILSANKRGSHSLAATYQKQLDALLAEGPVRPPEPLKCLVDAESIELVQRFNALRRAKQTADTWKAKEVSDRFAAEIAELETKMPPMAEPQNTWYSRPPWKYMPGTPSSMFGDIAGPATACGTTPDETDTRCASAGRLAVGTRFESA